MTIQKTGASLLLLAILLLGAPAFAHGLNIFAWLENGQILVQCDFGQGRPAVNAHITVYDSVDKKELTQGQTSAQGKFSFTVPEVIRQGHGLTIVADAGQGHRGEWSMDASELYAAAALTAGFEHSALQNGHGDASTPGTPLPQAAVPGQQLRAIIDEALELKLAPIRREIAALSASGPTIAEIVGGIGWIIGLVGIGLYFKSRKN